MEILYLYYFGIINIITIFTFILDKIKATLNSQNRISEFKFHLLEILGGCFSTFLLINLINHKKAKNSYLIISYLILTFWIFLLIQFRENFFQ